MVKAPSHQLHQRRWYRGEKAGKALVKWLNQSAPGHSFKWAMAPTSGRPFVQELLVDAQVVFRQLTKYKSAGQFHAAHRAKKIPSEFLVSYGRLNEGLGMFIRAPSVELQDVYDGSLVSWMITDESPMAHVRAQVSWLLQIIREGAILKIRRCEQCEDWFFARFSHQTFCKRSCQAKAFSQTDESRAKRRVYMREYRKR
jgi:hypothetical protein